MGSGPNHPPLAGKERAMGDEKLTGFVRTPIGIMHAENHRRLIESLGDKSATRVMLLPAEPVDAAEFFKLAKETP